MKVDAEFSAVVHIDPYVGVCVGEDWDRWIEESNRKVGMSGSTYLYYGQTERHTGWDFVWVGEVLYRKATGEEVWVKVVPANDGWNTDLFAICFCGETDFRILNYGDYFIEMECVSCKRDHKVTTYGV